MSEYQYYEFQAIDRPLDARSMAALRKITSRAEITPTSLINEYHFGDFKGDPARLMEEYFDAFLYFANWGTHQLMLRLPASAFDLAAAKPYKVENTLEAWSTKVHVIFDFTSHLEAPDWEEGPEGWLDELIPLRSELIAGDLRCLYLGWLAGVINDSVDEDELEPPVPPGLRHLTGTLRRLADFLWLDKELIEVAAEASPGEAPSGPSDEELAAWVARLPEREKNELLRGAIQGEAGHLGTKLLQRFWRHQAGTRPAATVGPARRTAGDLMEARDKRQEQKRQRAQAQAAKKQAQKARKEAEARTRYLDSLSERGSDVWREVEAAIRTMKPKEYDRAVTLLKDLHELAEREGDVAAFTDQLRRLRERHSGKSSLKQRLYKAGLSG